MIKSFEELSINDKISSIISFIVGFILIVFAISMYYESVTIITFFVKYKFLIFMILGISLLVAGLFSYLQLE